MSNRTMKEVVDEFNKLSGQNIKRFSTVAVGEKRIEFFKKGLFKETGEVAKPKANRPVEKASAVKPSKPSNAKGHKQRITVDGNPYRSVAEAFTSLDLPMNKHIRFRTALKVSGKETFEHESRKYVFVIIKQESLA